MSFGFFDVIFGGKGLEIDTYEPPNFIWSYHTHTVVFFKNDLILPPKTQIAKFER